MLLLADLARNVEHLNGCVLLQAVDVELHADSGILDAAERCQRMQGAVLTARSDKAPMSAAMQLRRIKVYVRTHLRNPRLSPAMIAAEFGISARYVHALFRDEPITLGNYIRSLRLAECRRVLEENPAGEQSLTDLALHWGFYDLSHMSRRFREEFRLTPREFRKRAAQSAAAGRDLGI